MFPHQAEAFVKKHATVNENIVFILTGGNIVAFVTCAGRHTHTHTHTHTDTQTHTHMHPLISFVMLGLQSGAGMSAGTNTFSNAGAHASIRMSWTSSS